MLRNRIISGQIVIMALLAGIAATMRAAEVNVDTLAARLDYQRWVYPQEKLHVMTDMGKYMGGDTIWLRAFVADAATHQPTTMSKYVYVELINPFDSVQNRVKLTHRKGGAYSGFIPLDAKMAEGEYTLTAYTMFSENLGPDYFFKKKIGVRSPFSTRNAINATWHPDKNGMILDLTYTDVTTGRKKDYAGMSIDTYNGKSQSGGKGLKDRSFSLSKEDITKGAVRVRYNNYEKFIAVPEADMTDAMDVQFFPEGGYMVPGVACRIGVKAIGADGYGRDIEGQIRDEAQNVVAEFKTLHRGMGVVSMVPKAGERYTAVMVTPSGAELSVPLPEASAMATVLQIDNSRRNSVTVTVAGQMPQGLSLLAQCRGHLLFATGITDDATSAVLPRERLPEGIIQFLLLDRGGNTLSERLIFNNGTDHKESTLENDHKEYGPRKCANFTLKLPEGTAADGNFAVAVTDTRLAEADSVSSIRAQLLLQSELRGHIEDAGYYFRHTDGRTMAALDALLLTQGWRRYDVRKSILGEFAYPQRELEIGHQLSGQVRSHWRGKPVENATVQVLNPRMLIATSVKTDAEGRYSVSGLDYPDGSRFIVQALLPKGKTSYNFDVDEQKYPSISALRMPSATSGKTGTQKVDYGSQWKLSHNNGVMDILMDEVSITFYKYNADPDKDVFDVLARKAFKADEWEKEGITTWEEILRKIPGININSGDIIYRGLPVAIFMDGVRWYPPGEISDGDSKLRSAYLTDPKVSQRMFNMYNTLPMANLSRFEEMKHIFPLMDAAQVRFIPPGPAAVLGAMEGALMITMKDGKDNAAWKQPDNLKVYAPLGYQKAARFYSPKYEVNTYADGTDMRSTVYWNPCVELKDGRGEFSFYTNDNENTTYTIRCQGLTDDGQIIDTTGTITVR